MISSFKPENAPVPTERRDAGPQAKTEAERAAEQAEHERQNMNVQTPTLKK